MNGIEKITSRISEDMSAEIEKIKADAKAQCDEIIQKSEKQAGEEYERLVKQGGLDAETRRQRLISVAELEAKKSVLAKKQELISAAFDRAVNMLCELPRDEYVSLLATLAARASSEGKTPYPDGGDGAGGKAIYHKAVAFVSRVAGDVSNYGTEQIILSAKDRADVGQQVCQRANELLAAEGMPAVLALSDETRDMRGGIVLVKGSVETNCSFDVLVSSYKNELSGEVAKILFD